MPVTNTGAALSWLATDRVGRSGPLPPTSTRIRIRARTSARTIDEPHRAASQLELLFDLVFVVATAQLALRIADGHALTGLAGFLQVTPGISHRVVTRRRAVLSSLAPGHDSDIRDFAPGRGFRHPDPRSTDGDARRTGGMP